MKSLLESNLQILYNDIKNKARIYIKDSAYVIGIMDEFGILEYGQAFLHIKRRKLDLILNKKCTIAKCPCLHPGDVRILDFKKYIPGDESTEKYKIFERYENVLIFPSKGKRPHPNECSGSDLDGDNYFVFYDEDLILDENNISEPMNYTFNLNSIKKDNIQIKDVIEYFAEYTNLNNLGIIGDAHLALCDKDPKHAKGEIPIRVAQKFSRAVDAPKTGDDVSLDEEENPKKFPHYMCKAPSKSYYSNFILGRLFDEVNKIIDSVTKKKEISKFYYDNKLELNGWEKFALMAMVFYRDFFEEMFSLMKKIDVKGESILLTGNNIDNDESVYTKRKNNYDLREKIADEMRRMFSLSKSNFEYGVKIFFLIKNFEFPILKGLNEELFFRNNLNLFASACYMISYNFLK
jgi:RNA-dependent RNA polymerase